MCLPFVRDGSSHPPLGFFTFAKVHLPGRSMPRVLVDGEVVRAEVLPRQRAHQDPPQGREGAAGNLSIHFAGSHIIECSRRRASLRRNVPDGETSGDLRPAWLLRRGRHVVLHPLTALIRVTGGRKTLSRADGARSLPLFLPRDTRAAASTGREAPGSLPVFFESAPTSPIARRNYTPGSALRPINFAPRVNVVIRANG